MDTSKIPETVAAVPETECHQEHFAVLCIYGNVILPRIVAEIISG
jgi:hypothetical protein